VRRRLPANLAGGGAWVASVENGYVFGMLSRIDARTGKGPHRLAQTQSSAHQVATATVRGPHSVCV
jgi:hypothetical protein